jgi:hypothetical protein
MRLGNAPLHRPPSPPYLSALTHPLLPEDSQQDDASVGRYPVADPHRLSREMKPELAQLAMELPRIRLAQQHPALG